MTATSLQTRMQVSTSAPVRWRRPHYLALIGIALVQALIRAEVPLGQDMLWGARYGLDVLSSGRLPRADAYSWTAFGKQWVPSSWAWNVVLGAVYDAAGVTGFWLLGGALSVATALTVAHVARRLGAHPLATLAIYVPVGLLGLEAVPRAQCVSNIAVIVLIAIVPSVVIGNARSAWRALFLLCLVEAAWMNIHTVALLGPAVVFVCGLAVLCGRRAEVELRRSLARLGFAVVATSACTLLTPYGVLPISHAGDVRAASVGLVTEWAPAGLGSVASTLDLLAVPAAVVLAIVVWRSQRHATAAAVMLLAACSASALRFLPMLALVAAPEVALVVSHMRIRPKMLRMLAAAPGVVLTLIALTDARDLRSLGPTVSPGLVAQIPPGCRLLNDDLVGDAVTLTRSDVPVALDGRYDMYGRRIVTSVEDMFEDKPGTAMALVRDQVGCILGPTSMPLIQRLKASPEWSIAGRDQVRTLLLRLGGSS